MEQGEFDEAAVWAAARTGDAGAFQQVFDAHRDRVFGQALRHLRSTHDAEDATALVFLEAWRRRDAVRVVNGSIVGWLLVTTNYVGRNLVRGLRRHREAMERAAQLTTESTLDLTGEVDERLDRRGRDHRVRTAFARLSTADQDVITLCVLEELPTSQAAMALGVPLGTVKSRLSRAKRRLARLTELEGGSLAAGATGTPDTSAPADPESTTDPTRTGGAR